MKANEIAERIIGVAIDVDRELGPGIIEKAVGPCLCGPLHSLCTAYGEEFPQPA